ncbi:hypothetical protein TGPRC2_424490 [Toxoplasma gondii TgCatPRC2]|uniref:Uncharacterized protein n=1 Tax=Toxoplasma gondii TgCatPRC2 TaxID=1130821 RepID=A0A151HGX4_TOXGO|nr:hypothetical protein TGPRC2_424490 [Toxoplasma gondii TgCatPRC2]
MHLGCLHMHAQMESGGVGLSLKLCFFSTRWVAYLRRPKGPGGRRPSSDGKNGSAAGAGWNGSKKGGFWNSILGSPRRPLSPQTPKSRRTKRTAWLRPSAEVPKIKSLSFFLPSLAEPKDPAPGFPPLQSKVQGEDEEDADGGEEAEGGEEAGDAVRQGEERDQAKTHARQRGRGKEIHQSARNGTAKRRTKEHNGERRRSNSRKPRDAFAHTQRQGLATSPPKEKRNVDAKKRRERREKKVRRTGSPDSQQRPGVYVQLERGVEDEAGGRRRRRESAEAEETGAEGQSRIQVRSEEDEGANVRDRKKEKPI